MSDGNLPPRLLFGRITPANARATLNSVAIAWSAIVAIQILGIATHFGIGGLPYLVLSLHWWSAAGAYFVWSRKSRAVAIAHLLTSSSSPSRLSFPMSKMGRPLPTC
jgi:hypothetical protein